MSRKVSLLFWSQDVFFCRTCLGQNCSVKEWLNWRKVNIIQKRWKSVVILATCLAWMAGHLKRWVQEYVVPERSSKSQVGSCLASRVCLWSSIIKYTIIVSDWFFRTIVKLRNLLLQMSWSWMRWNRVSLRRCVRKDWLIESQVLGDVLREEVGVIAKIEYILVHDR